MSSEGRGKTVISRKSKVIKSIGTSGAKQRPLVTRYSLLVTRYSLLFSPQRLLNTEGREVIESTKEICHLQINNNL